MVSGISIHFGVSNSDRFVCGKPVVAYYELRTTTHLTERLILKKKQDRDQEWSLTSSSSRDELEKNVLMRMKSVTDASEDVCISLLEANSYDLKTSIEAYLSSP